MTVYQFQKKNKSSKESSSKPEKNKHHKKDSVDKIAEKELMIHRQAELQYQLNASKHSLEKQMRKMRKKFERALQATDDRFVEQKRREESFHNQLRTELEIIEQSLERGSKKNVEDFSHHIRTELNSLADRLMRGSSMGADTMKSSDDTDEPGSPIKRSNKRESAVNLDRTISVSLQNCGGVNTSVTTSNIRGDGRRVSSPTSSVSSPKITNNNHQPGMFFLNNWFDYWIVSKSPFNGHFESVIRDEHLILL